MRSLTLVVLATLVTRAHAQPVVDDLDQKSEPMAVALSAGVPLAGLALGATAYELRSTPLALVALGAVVLGPSSGRWYAHDADYGHLVARSIGATSIIAGAAAIGWDTSCDLHCGSLGGVPVAVFGLGLVAQGAALVLGSAIHDVIATDRVVDRWNHDHAIQLAPIASSASGHRTTGVVLEGRF